MPASSSQILRHGPLPSFDADRARHLAGLLREDGRTDRAERIDETLTTGGTAVETLTALRSRCLELEELHDPAVGDLVGRILTLRADVEALLGIR